MRLKHCFALLLSLVHWNYAGPLSQRPRSPYDIPASEFFDIDPAAVATSPNVNQVVTQVCVDIVYGPGSTSVNCIPQETVPAASPATQTDLPTPVVSGNQPGDAPLETEKIGASTSSTIEQIPSPSQGTTLRCPNGTPKPPAIILIPSIAIPSNLITASPGPLPSRLPNNPTSTPSYLGTRSLPWKKFPLGDDDDDDDMDMPGGLSMPGMTIPEMKMPGMDPNLGNSIVSDVNSEIWGDDNSASTQAPPPPPPPPPPSPSPQSPAPAQSSPSPPLPPPPPPPPPTTASSPTPQPPSKTAATAPRVVTKPPEPEVVWTTTVFTEFVTVTVTINSPGAPPTMSTKASPSQVPLPSNTRGKQDPESKPEPKPEPTAEPTEEPSHEPPPTSSERPTSLGNSARIGQGRIVTTKSPSATTAPASPGTGPARNPAPTLTTQPNSQKPAPTPAPTSKDFTTIRAAHGLGKGDDDEITETPVSQGTVSQDPGVVPELLGAVNKDVIRPLKTEGIQPIATAVGLNGGDKGDKGNGKGKGKGKGEDGDGD
ncbi:hypothetical protein FQN55_009215 [Onygenales sp. PD_40]|nr:hypothetical protein FQN55_009215 [Onygenales sp. PD_40]